MQAAVSWWWRCASLEQVLTGKQQVSKECMPWALNCSSRMLHVYMIYIYIYDLYMIYIIYIYSPGTALRAVPILECAAVLVCVHLYGKTGHAVTTPFLVSYDSMSSCDSVGPYLELQAMLFSQVQPISNWRQSISRWVDRSINVSMTWKVPGSCGRIGGPPCRSIWSFNFRKLRQDDA